MPERIRELWNYEVGDQATCVALTSNGRFVIAGSKDKHVYFFDRSGKLLWQGDVDGQVLRLVLAEGLQRVLAGCSSGKAYLWDYDGQLLHVFQTDGIILGIDITPNAELVAIGTVSHTLYLFDGTTTLLWKNKVGDAIRRLTITPDGRYIALGSQDHSIYLFERSGNKRWEYKTNAPVWAGAQIAPTAEYVLAGSNDRHVYLLDRDGQLKWKKDTGGSVNVALLTPDSRFIAAAGNANTIFLFNSTGERLWSYRTRGEVYGLAISHDGRFLVAGSDDHHVYLFDKAGNCIWNQKTHNSLNEVAITPSGRLLAAASNDHSIYVYENLYAPEENSWLARIVIRRIRSTYVRNPHLGIAHWFEEFDRTLLQDEFAICHELLRELRTEGYSLSSQEHVYVDSREGVLLLCQGINYHKRREYANARECYNKSLNIQQRLRYLDGEGQANAAITILNFDEQHQESNTRELEQIARTATEALTIGTNEALLAQLATKPMVVGTGQTLLAERIKQLSPADQLQVILAAQEAGYRFTLLQALQHQDPSVQAAAAIALNRLKPGPDYEKLVEMLSASNWIVRWQAAVMLKRRADERQSEFAQYRNTVQQAISRRLTSDEHDPMVLCAMLSLLCLVGDAADTPYLVQLLSNSDPEVRFATIVTLAQIGDRRALTGLHRVKDGTTFEGNRISDRAGEAIRSIEQRYPISEVQSMVFCRELTAQRQAIQPATIFLAHERIYCVVTLSMPNPQNRISCYLRQQAGTPQPVPTSATSPTSFVLSLSPPVMGMWSPTTYSVLVIINDIQREQSFKVINQVGIERAVICLETDANGRPVNGTSIFSMDVQRIHCSVALEEAPTGLEIRGQVYRKNSPTPIAESRVKTAAEGKQSVALSWESAQWRSGEYNVIVATAPGTRTNCTFRVAPRVSSWLVSMLIWLPLLMQVLAYSLGTITTTFVLNKTFGWLLLGGLIVAAVIMGLGRLKGDHLGNNDELSTAGIMALLVAGTVAFSLVGKLTVGLPGMLAIGALIGVAVGMASGLAGNMKGSPLNHMITGLAVCVALTVSGITAFYVAQFASGLVGNLMGIALGGGALLVAGVIVIALAYGLAYLVVLIITFIMSLGLTGVIGAGLVSGAVIAWRVGLSDGILVGLVYVLAVGLAAIVRRSIKIRFSSLMSSAIFIALALSYAAMVWIYFLGGWAVLAK